MSDLFEELKVPPPDAPGEDVFRKIMQDLSIGDDLPNEFGPDVIQRLLVALKQYEKEATMFRLKEVMGGHGYRLDESDPDHLVFRRI